MIEAKVVATGIKNLTAKITAEQKRLDNAERVAVRVEGFRLMNTLREEIRQGRPGGRAFAPLSIIRRTQGAYRGGGLRSNRPLFRLARTVGYDAKRVGGSYELKIGFIKGTPQSSKMWRWLAANQQRGFSRDAESSYFVFGSKSIREMLAWRGSQIEGKTFSGRRSRRRNVFFLRKSTQHLKTPARPIIDPFWIRYRHEAVANIRSNFIRKARGEVI